jgi:phage terminase large subunit GpA-like protein
MVLFAPAAMMVVEANDDLSKRLVKQRLNPMFEDADALRALVRDPRERGSGCTMLEKEFPGGLLVITSAQSPAGLRMMSAQNLFLDEVDAYPYDLKEEGSPAYLAEKRTLAFPRHKIFYCSKPKLKRTSVIEPKYLASDRRRYHVPCLKCGHGQVLRWAGLKWPKGRPDLAEYECARCSRMIAEHHKTQMLEEGRWIAENPSVTDIAGFHINMLYAPYGWSNSWPALAKQHVEITHSRDRRRLQEEVNSVFAETWEEKGPKVNEEALHARKRMYPAPVPADALILTAFVDTQDDRLEAEVVGWGRGKESWAIEFRRFLGSPAQKTVWNELDVWLQQTWTHQSGVPMGIQIAGIDFRGHHAQDVYEFVRPRQNRRVFACGGATIHGAPLYKRGSKVHGCQLILIGTETAKDTLLGELGWFNLTDPGPGYCHFPEREEYDEEYFAQLASEEKRPKYDKGIIVGDEYKQTRTRNEALDIRVGNLAMLALFNPDLDRLAMQVSTWPQTGPPHGMHTPPEPRRRRLISRGIG